CDFATQAFKKNWIKISLYSLIIGIIQGGLVFFYPSIFFSKDTFSGINTTPSYILKSISEISSDKVYLLQALTFPIYFVLDNFATRIVEKNYNPKNLFTWDFNVLNYVLFNIIYFVAIFLGFLAFVIPGLYLIVRFSMARNIFMNEQENVIDSFSKSWEMTKGIGSVIFSNGFFVVVLASVILILSTFLFVIPVSFTPLVNLNKFFDPIFVIFYGFMGSITNVYSNLALSKTYMELKMNKKSQ
ncbi:MAG: hypothetical protein ACRCXZ_07200, partial [Patescibacteria group bacterium]